MTHDVVTADCQLTSTQRPPTVENSGEPRIELVDARELVLDGFPLGFDVRSRKAQESTRGVPPYSRRETANGSIRPCRLIANQMVPNEMDNFFALLVRKAVCTQPFVGEIRTHVFMMIEGP